MDAERLIEELQKLRGYAIPLSEYPIVINGVPLKSDMISVDLSRNTVNITVPDHANQL